jgi:cytoskeletal protein RodZ
MTSLPPSRQARLERARRIRRRVITGALALFVAAWLLIAVALASGHDPALSTKTTALSTKTSPQASSSSTPTVTTSSSGASSASSSTQSSSSATQAPASSSATPLTTAQS